MANLPDGKPPRKSKSIVGAGVAALGGLITLVGWVISGETEIPEALELLSKYLGPIITAVGYVLNKWGHRSIEGENKALMSAVLKGTTKLALDNASKKK